MIHVQAENDPDQRGFEVRAVNSGCALLRVLVETNALATEKLLHSIHVGAPYSASVPADVVETWPIEDRFERLP
jgi:hypothetical protein